MPYWFEANSVYINLLKSLLLHLRVVFKSDIVYIFDHKKLVKNIIKKKKCEHEDAYFTWSRSNSTSSLTIMIYCGLAQLHNTMFNKNTFRDNKHSINNLVNTKLDEETSEKVL